MSVTKQEIITTAVTLFKEKSFSATTMQDIADALNVTKAALYYYISGKEEILYEIFDHTMTTAEIRLARLLERKLPIEELFREIIYNQIMAFIDEMPNITIFFSELVHLPPEHQKSMKDRRKKYQDTIACVLGKGIENDTFRKIDILPIVYGIIGMCNWLYHWYKPDGRLQPEEIADLYADMVFNGIIKKDLST
jgi:AcrR family transcriptional regulator